MAVITTVPARNLWNDICAEFEVMRRPYDDAIERAKTVPSTYLVNYDATKHSPVFYGDMHARVPVDSDVTEEFDVTVSHPACVGYALLTEPEPTPPETPPTPPSKITCPAREYLEVYVFPILLPALEEMLRQAKLERCFERKLTKFNAADFLTEYLYKNNPRYSDRQTVTLADIPFVCEWWQEHPRKPLPNSVYWSEADASLVIQSFWRGYQTRLDSEVQELRQWQREWREEGGAIHATVNKFWARKMPDDASTSPPSADSPGKAGCNVQFSAGDSILPPTSSCPGNSSAT